MPNYRRYRLDLPVFVTIVTRGRRPWLADTGIEPLLAAMREIKPQHPFRHYAHVILPDHLHWLFKPLNGSDFSGIVASLKREVTWRLKEQGLSGPFWQDRFYDHLIRDDADLQRHLDYIHFNPVKHGHCAHPADWPHSSYRAWLERGAYTPGWGATIPESITGMDIE
jgi:Transposase and inactivated derivatives